MNETFNLVAERDKLQKRLDLINVRCDARSKLEARIYQLDARIAQRPQIERVAR